MTMRTSLLLAVLLLLAACSSPSSPVVGGHDYAPQYDFSEFYAATNGKMFRVIVAGNPFPQIPQQEMQQRLLPVMQANRPRPRLTFTYAVPAELPRPDYRLVLVFDAANDLTAARVCAGEIRLKPHVAEPSGRFSVFAVYCRSDQWLSQTTGSTPATAPEDPRVGALFSQLFLVLFTDSPMMRPSRFPFFMPFPG
ncbi:MAG: hypothetical protein JSS04_19820 [Proteobacteria bacterium]|nr:hypothetical protein [Pseudomonadota bacterium]